MKEVEEMSILINEAILTTFLKRAKLNMSASR